MTRDELVVPGDWGERGWTKPGSRRDGGFCWLPTGAPRDGTDGPTYFRVQAAWSVAFPPPLSVTYVRSFSHPCLTCTYINMYRRNQDYTLPWTLGPPMARRARVFGRCLKR